MAQVGTNGNDPDTYFNNTDPVIYGLDGDDVIRFAGAPVPPVLGIDFAPGHFEGGRGNDTIFSGPGSDTVYGGDGNDIIDGGAGEKNFLDGGNGDDVIYARGTRIINGLDLGYGDTVFGQAGNDTIYALGTATHNIYGGFGNDIIYGNRQSGYGDLEGGDGNDIIYGGVGYSVDGGDGNDIIYGERALSLTGGNGDDTYEVTTPEQFIFEGEPVNPFARPDFDTVFAYVDFSLPISVEKLVMIYGTQTYGYGNEQANLIFGNARNNVIEGRGGYDTLTGGAGSDLFLVNPNWGVDVITDFVAGAGTPDAIVFSTKLFSTFDQVMAKSRQVGADVWIEDGLGNTVVLSGISIGTLHQNDFGFV